MHLAMMVIVAQGIRDSAHRPAPLARRTARFPFGCPAPFLFGFGLRGLAAVEGVGLGVVERGSQCLLAPASQAPPHRRVRALVLQLPQGGDDDGHGLVDCRG
ncbi:hypothetical protein ACWEO4_39855 [Streptomyces sp. NPDC004393]